MKNKGLWIMLAINLIIGFIFIIVISVVRTNLYPFVITYLGVIILIEIPINHLVSNLGKEKKE